MWMFWLGVAIVIMTFWLIFKGIREIWLITTPGGQNHSPGNLVDRTSS